MSKVTTPGGTRSSQEPNIYNKFQSDKKSTLNAIEEFLQSTPESLTITQKDLETYRSEAVRLVSQGNFTEALQQLERLRDAKSGIVMKEVIQDGVPVIIRDARGVKNPPVRETEAFEMQYLNAVRAGMDIAEIAGNSGLKEVLSAEATKFMQEFSQNKGLSQEELAGLLKEQIKNLGKVLEENGIPDAYKKLNIAKDFQNFNDKHSNIVTVSSIEHNGQKHTVIEAEVAMKGLTESQKKQYENISQSKEPIPSWYTAMPKWEQELCKKYASKIAAGEHVIPTQLRQIAGMKNAFEKITAISAGGELEILHTSKHAGTLASLARDKNARQDITDGNARQAQEWIGLEKTLHCNTFNSGPLGAGDDPEIVRSTKKAMDNVGGKQTNTAFNSFRYSGFANDLKGAKDTLKMLSASLPEDKEFKKIKSYLQPKGFFGRLFRRGTPEKEIQDLFAKGKIDATTVEILKSAVDLKRSVEKADSLLRFGDAENASLATSTKLNKLTNTLLGLESEPKGIVKLPKKEEILNMCASGKDRTGLAEHDQSARAIATKIGAPISDIDKQLLASGHIAQQAGGINSGGATIGCYGTKSENRAGIPASRKENLETIVEVTANSNKIKGKSKLKEPKVAAPVKPSTEHRVQTEKPQPVTEIPIKSRSKSDAKVDSLSSPETPVQTAGRGRSKSDSELGSLSSLETLVQTAGRGRSKSHILR